MYVLEHILSEIAPYFPSPPRVLKTTSENPLYRDQTIRSQIRMGGRLVCVGEYSIWFIISA